MTVVDFLAVFGGLGLVLGFLAAQRAIFTEPERRTVRPAENGSATGENEAAASDEDSVASAYEAPK